MIPNLHVSSLNRMWLQIEIKQEKCWLEVIENGVKVVVYLGQINTSK